jgi:hypothetical protein
LDDSYIGHRLQLRHGIIGAIGNIRDYVGFGGDEIAKLSRGVVRSVIPDSVDHYVIDRKIAMDDISLLVEKFQH